MNNKIKVISCSFCMLILSETTFADAAYLQKFQTYQKYAADIPEVTDSEFISFISIPSPLTNKLRAKLLYKLAKDADWQNYNKYYRPTDDVSLQCYAQEARLQFEDKDEVVKDILPIWLSGKSQPDACTHVFNTLLSDQAKHNTYINQRVAKSLEHHNYSLAIYLLKKSKPSQESKLKLLNQIQHNPRKINMLSAGELSGDFYLYGLKKISRHDPKLAVRLFNHPHAKTIMTKQQQQNFLAHFALFKAIRNKDDAPFWLAKVDKDAYTEALTDWQMRYAIGHKNWQQLLKLIDLSPEKESTRLKYWQARSYEAMGNKVRADEIYQSISNKRNYYGFLASNKLKVDLSFLNEQVNHTKDILSSYQPITDEIKSLHDNHKILQASRMINDFSSELGKSELSAFAYWIAKELNWNGKSIYLCNNEDLFNQLALRFPLAHKSEIFKNSKRYEVAVPLIYAVIRQESAFFENITSSAGARGLMQVMPQTAKQVSRKSKISYKSATELSKANKNINIGTAYLKQLSDRFDDNLVYMIAAYNAGPRQVNSWLKNKPHKDMDIWIETIPWAETRNYVKNVIAFYAVYQYRLYNKHTLAEFRNYF